MTEKSLIVLGSGPGIGVAVASAFASRGFTHVALIARNKDRLQEDERAVLDAVKKGGKTCHVKTLQCDLSDLEELRGVLHQLEAFAPLNCVLFNAARVAGEPPLKETTEAIETDFRLTNLALYEVAKWAIPLLQQSNTTSPSLFVTSTTQLYKEPHYDLFSLSMVKSAQRALVLSLHNKFGKDVHIALLSIGGVVSPDAQNLSPENIANKAWELYSETKDDWKRECEIHE